MSSGLLLHAIMACGNVMSLNLARTSLNLARLESSTAKGTLFYDRSFLTIFPMSIFEINTENVYIFLTNHKYQYDQVFFVKKFVKLQHS